MAIDAPEGGLSYAEHHLAVTLAACARFRTWCGSANAAAALADRIHFDAWPAPANGQVYTPPELDQLLPSALIFTAEGTGYQAHRVAKPSSWQGSGSLMFQLQEIVPQELAKVPGHAMRRFKNTLGVILEEFKALCGTAGYLDGRLFFVAGPWRCDPDDVIGQADAHLAELTVVWGPPS